MGTSPCYQLVNPLFLWSFSIAILTKPEGISIKSPLNPIKTHQITIFLWFSYCFPMCFLWALPGIIGPVVRCHLLGGTAGALAEAGSSTLGIG